MPIDHNHESFGFLVVLALCLPPITLYSLLLILLPSHRCPIVLQEMIFFFNA